MGWSAFEDDSESGLMRVVQILRNVTRMVLSFMAGDYCAVTQQIMSVVAAESNNYTDHFGKASLTVFSGRDQDPPNLYGVPSDALIERFEIAGSSTRSPLMAARDAVRAGCSILSFAEAPSLTKARNVSGTVLDLFRPEDYSSRGHIQMRLAHYLPIRRLGVILEKLELDSSLYNAQDLIACVHFRAGTIGDDVLSRDQDGTRDASHTPFQLYVGKRDIPVELDTRTERVLLDLHFEQGDDRLGTAALYTEFNVNAMLQIYSSEVLLGNGVHSETRYLEDLFYGAWDLEDLNHKRFTKPVVIRIEAPDLRGYLHLRYVLDLADLPQP